MFISPQEALTILEHYKYLLIFPITVVEGPIIIIISGFLVYLGFLNAISAYIILSIADIIGDSLYYAIGLYWRRWAWIKKYARLLGYNENSEAFLESHFRKHKGKTFLLAKISHGIGGAIQIAAGIARVNYWQFLFYSIIGTLPKTLILMLIGFYLGSSYIKIDGIFNYIAMVTVGISVLLIFFYVILQKYLKKFFNTPSSE